MLFRLEDVSWAASAVRLIKLSILPPGYRVRGFKIFSNMVGTKDAADAVANTSFAAFIPSVKLNPRLVDMSGLALQDLASEHRGRDVCLGTAIPGSGTTFDVNHVLEVPLRDERQIGQEDGGIPTEMLMSKSLELQMAAANGGAAVAALQFVVQAVRSFAMAAGRPETAP